MFKPFAFVGGFGVGLLLLAVTLALLAGCSTIQSYQAGGASWQQLALSSCEDLELSETAASAGIAWARVYFPAFDALFKTNVEPIMLDVSAGVDAYCAAAQMVQGVDGLQALLAKKSELLALVDKIAVLVATIKGS